MENKKIFKVIFLNQNKVYEIYAQDVRQGELYGFVEIEELLFDEKQSLVVDPAEERLKSEFESVKKTFIPMHAIIRIDQVEKKGVGKILSFGDAKDDNITPFPTSFYSPRKDS